MKKLALLFPLGAVMAAAVWAFAAGDAGDPLASLSYLRSDFTQTVEQKVDKALDTSDAELRTRLEDGTVADLTAAWQEVRLKEGDTLQGVTGTNVLSLAGSVRVTYSSGAVVDATTGSVVPSGTALMLADAINEENDGAYHYVYDRSSVRQKRDPKEIGISSVRGGSIVGDHEVLFCGPDEVITLKHTAYSRSIFANGAINAAVYLAKKEPGLYNMGNMIAEM